MIKSYRDLLVWQQAMGLAESCYRCTARMPSSEAYGLVSQMRRAAVSVPANIAEGFSRRSRRSYLHHLVIASGSLAELDCLCELAERIHLLNQADSGALVSSCGTVGRRLSALVRALQKSDADRPRHLTQVHGDLSEPT